jgi:hypothetical protein
VTEDTLKKFALIFLFAGALQSAVALGQSQSTAKPVAREVAKVSAKSPSVVDICQKKLTALVVQTVKAMGNPDPIGIHWDGPEQKGQSSGGEKLYVYSTGVFIQDGGTEETEGFLPDSGAKAIVVREKNSCKVLHLEVSIGS